MSQAFSSDSPRRRERAIASEPRERSAPAKRRARERVGESEGGEAPRNNQSNSMIGLTSMLPMRDNATPPPLLKTSAPQAQRSWTLKMFSTCAWMNASADRLRGTRSNEDAKAVFARMQELLSLAIDVDYCPHAAGPPACWCRKPLPGLGALLVHRHQLDPARCIYVGAGPQDPGFARKLGFAYQPADDFF